MKTKNRPSRARVSKIPSKLSSSSSPMLINKTDHPENENSSENPELTPQNVTQQNCEDSDVIVPDTPTEDDEDRNAVVCNGLFCTLSIHQCRNLHSFDDNGNLYCPHCWYKCQILQLEELHKQMILAKKDAQLARKSLTLFLNSTQFSDDPVGDNCEERVHVNEIKTSEVEQVRNVNGTAGVEVNDKVTVSSVRNREGEEVHCEQNKNNADPLETRVGVDDDDGANLEKIDQDIDLLGQVFAQPCPQENINEEAEMVEKEGEKENEQQVHSHHINFNNVNPFANFQYQDSVVCQRTSDCEDTVSSETALNCNELSGASRKPAKHYRPGKRSTNPALPDSRRKKLPWSNDEEEMLRRAVKVFSLEGRKNFSWKSILEYGGLVFNGTRTPADLKDKWRNMEGSRAKHR